MAKPFSRKGVLRGYGKYGVLAYLMYDFAFVQPKIAKLDHASHEHYKDIHNPNAHHHWEFSSSKN